MLSGGFGEPLAYSLRIEKILRDRRGDFDIIHDNQCMGPGILKLHRQGWPLLETLHHPITVDRSIALDHAETPWKRYTTRRWFGFLRMQVRTVKQLPAVLTVSHNSKIDINAQMRVPLERLTVVPVGVDHTVFRPYDDVVKKKGRLMVTSSSDVPMKGLVPLLEAIAKLRAERDIDLVVIGKPQPKGRVAAALDRLGLTDIVTTISGVSDEELARLYGEAEVAIVPSLYEGFSLPAIEAMSCGVPVVATTGGALPEVVGVTEETGLLVEPNNPEALVVAIGRLLDDAALRERLGAAGRAARDGALHLGGDRARHGRLLRRHPHRPAAARVDGVRLMLTAQLRPARSANAATRCSTSGAVSDATPSKRRAAARTSSPWTPVATKSKASRTCSPRWSPPVSSTPTRLHTAAVQGDALHLPFPDATFDRVICSEVLEHIPDDLGAMSELARVLKPGGTMADHRAALRTGADQLGALRRVPQRAGRPHPHLPTHGS